MSFVNNLNIINSIKHNIKNAIETKGQTVTNFASYPASIENIISGGNGVKQYDSLENMYADISNAHNEDLATVYGVSLAQLWDGSNTTRLYFPASINVGRTWEGPSSIQFDNGKGSAYRSGGGWISNLQISIYDSSTSIRINYSGNWNGVYTRNEDIEYVEIEDGISCSNLSGSWVNFFLYDKIIFNGLYQYNGTNFNLLSNTGLDANIESVWDGKFYGMSGVQNANLNQTMNLNLQQLKDRVNLYSNISKLSSEMNNSANLFMGDTYIKNIPELNLSNVINASQMFYGCSNLKIISNLNLKRATSLSKTFAECNSLESISNFYVDLPKNMYGMFALCNNLKIIPNFDTSNVTSMAFALEYCRNLVSMPNWNTSNVTNMSGMFMRTKIDILANVNLDMNNVIDASAMFSGSFGFTNISNSLHLSMPNVKYANMMFKECYDLYDTPVINFNLVIDMTNMFAYCSNLVNVSNFNTSNVTNMAWMFINCNNLTTVPNFNTTKVTNMYFMFRYCTNLVNVSNFSTSNVTNMCQTFLRMS